MTDIIRITLPGPPVAAPELTPKPGDKQYIYLDDTGELWEVTRREDGGVDWREVEPDELPIETPAAKGRHDRR